MASKYESLEVAASRVESAGVGDGFDSNPAGLSPPLYSSGSTTGISSSPMMLEVVAPASLYEGYELDVNVGGDTFKVVVVRQSNRSMTNRFLRLTRFCCD